MTSGFSFAVLRYVHDPLTEEFANVGVVLYCRDRRYVSALCTEKYARLSNMFVPIEGGHYRQLIRFIESRVEEYAERMLQELPLAELPVKLEDILSKILTPDDSSFRFGKAGGGLTDDPGKTLEELFNRYVDLYDKKTERTGRGDKDVWKSFRAPLEARDVMQHLTAHAISGAAYEHEFDYAYKNEIWHGLESLSFDVADKDYIIDKATNWFGKVQLLADAKEKVKVYFLLGRPSDGGLRKTYDRAKNILHKTQVAHDFYEESDAEKLADDLKTMIVKHG